MQTERRFGTFRITEEVSTLTDMRRVTISMPDALDKQILSLSADERFAKCTYAEIVRRVLEIGLSSTDEASEGEGRYHG